MNDWIERVIFGSIALSLVAMAILAWAFTINILIDWLS